MNGDMWDASTWDDTVSEPLRLQGSGMIIHDLFTLWSDTRRWDLVDQVASLTDDFTIRFPGEAKYTMDVGFFSLNGVQENVTWTATNGSQISLHLQLPNAYEREAIPSISYGLHIGSPNLKIQPSLILGGYDKSRCLSDPISSGSQTFELLDIGLGVNEGDWTFTNRSRDHDLPVHKGDIKGFLGNSSSIEVMPNPGVPYLYLPQHTCDAIAEHLPVTYSEEFGLYLWNVDDPTFENITTAPTYLAFILKGINSSDSSNTTIKVPFTLLNLTLGNPLVTDPTLYFPCSPYSPSGEDKPYHLGRAFLQAALLAQNWQSKTVWLAQAPGPEIPPDQVTIIEETDTTLSKMLNGPDLFSTWGSVLKPVSSNSTGHAHHDISGGAIAGVVVGSVAALSVIIPAILFFLRRYRRQHRHTTPIRVVTTNDNRSIEGATEKSGQSMCEAASVPIFEAGCADKSPTLVDMPIVGPKSSPVEIEGKDSEVAELPGYELSRQ